MAAPTTLHNEVVFLQERKVSGCHTAQKRPSSPASQAMDNGREGKRPAVEHEDTPVPATRTTRQISDGSSVRERPSPTSSSAKESSGGERRVNIGIGDGALPTPLEVQMTYGCRYPVYPRQQPPPPWSGPYYRLPKPGEYLPLSWENPALSTRQPPAFIPPMKSNYPAPFRTIMPLTTSLHSSTACDSQPPYLPQGPTYLAQPSHNQQRPTCDGTPAQTQRRSPDMAPAPHLRPGPAQTDPPPYLAARSVNQAQPPYILRQPGHLAQFSDTQPLRARPTQPFSIHSDSALTDLPPYLQPGRARPGLPAYLQQGKARANQSSHSQAGPARPDLPPYLQPGRARTARLSDTLPEKTAADVSAFDKSGMQKPKVATQENSEPDSEQSNDSHARSVGTAAPSGAKPSPSAPRINTTAKPMPQAAPAKPKSKTAVKKEMKRRRRDLKAHLSIKFPVEPYAIEADKDDVLKKLKRTGEYLYVYFDDEDGKYTLRIELPLIRAHSGLVREWLVRNGGKLLKEDNPISAGPVAVHEFSVMGHRMRRDRTCCWGTRPDEARIDYLLALEYFEATGLFDEMFNWLKKIYEYDMMRRETALLVYRKTSRSSRLREFVCVRLFTGF